MFSSLHAAVLSSVEKTPLPASICSIHERFHPQGADQQQVFTPKQGR